MAIKQELNTLLSKKMDRKDFLRHMVIGVVALTGVGALVKTLAPVPAATTTSKTPSQNGYGTSVYGGKKTA